MYDTLTEQAGNELAVQNECSREEFNFKLAGQIDFIQSGLQDLTTSVCGSLIAQTDEGVTIIKDLLTIQYKLGMLKEGIV